MNIRPLSKEELDAITDEQDLNKYQMKIIRGYASTISEQMSQLEFLTDLVAYGKISVEDYKGIVERMKKNVSREAKFINQMLQD